MNLVEANRLLTYVASVDGRRVDDATVIAWQGIVGDLPLDDCMEATRRHFATTANRLMPAHVRELAIVIRTERRPKHEALSLPSRFEVDQERATRVRQGIALCAQALTMAAALRPRAIESEEKAPPTRSDQIRQRAIERAQRELNGRPRFRLGEPERRGAYRTSADVTKCSRCGAFYIDDTDGRPAHSTAFGHWPAAKEGPE